MSLPTTIILGATGVYGGTNAGTISANGVYVPVTGTNSTYNSATQYTNGTCYISWSSVYWQVCTGVNGTGTALYQVSIGSVNAILPYNWITLGGSAPAPTLALITTGLSIQYSATGASLSSANGVYLPVSSINALVSNATQYTNGTCYLSYNANGSGDSGFWYISQLVNGGGSLYYAGAGNPTFFPIGAWNSNTGSNANGTDVTSASNPPPTFYGPLTPTAPSALTLVDNTPTSINITIPALSGNATNYLLKRAPDVSGSPGTYTTLNGGSAVTPSTVYPDTSLTPGTIYWYMLVAVNGFGSTNGVATSITELPASPATLTLTVISSSQINIIIPTLAFVTGAIAFNLQRAPDVSGSPGTYTTISIGVTPNATYMDTSLNANTTYHYRLIAIDSGGSTNGSDSYTTTQIAGTSVPTAVTAVYVPNAGIMISWTAPTNYTPIGYNLYRLNNDTINGVPQLIDSGERIFIPYNKTSLIDYRVGTGLSSRTGSNTYIYYVTAIMPSGVESSLSSASNTVSFSG